MRKVNLDNTWCIVDDQGMIVAVCTYDPDDKDQDYKDACVKAQTAEMTITNMNCSYICELDIVTSIRLYIKSEQAEAAMEEVLEYMKGYVHETQDT